jgi:hypothetical protein
MSGLPIQAISIEGVSVMSTIEPTSPPPAEANAVPPAEPAASSPLAQAHKATEASGASALNQDGCSSNIAGSHSFPIVLDGQLTVSSASAVDQAQQSAASVSDPCSLVPAEQAKEGLVATTLPALVEAATQLDAPEMNSAKLPGRPFQPGRSGNPLGRPKGSRNRVTRFVEALIEGQGEAIGAKALQIALEGDSPMLREMLHRVAPRRREGTIEFDLPKIETASDARAASTALLDACMRGEVSPNEATQFMGLLTSHVRLVETADLEARVAALENERKK